MAGRTGGRTPSPANQDRRDLRTPLLVLGFAGLLAAWVLGNPPVAAPDEGSHYIKAMGTAYGQLQGEPLTIPSKEATPKLRFLLKLNQTFKIPPAYNLDPRLLCVRVHPTSSAACQNGLSPPPPPGRRLVSHVGPYHPFLYLPLGLAGRLAPDGLGALRLARFAGASVCLLLLAGAARCCRSRASAAGLVLAVTPMSLFLFSSVTTNGTEVAGGVCFTAATLALVRGLSGRETWAWWALGGVVLGLSKGLGAVWVAAEALLLVGLLGIKGTWTLFRRAGARSWLAAGTVAAAALVSLVWNQLALPSPPVDATPSGAVIASAVHALPRLLNQAIGWFGWLDTPMPHPLYLLARLLFAAAVLLALALGTWRQRVALVLAVALGAVATVAVTVGLERPLGFGPQARFTMALAVSVPLLCGHILTERRAHSPRPLAAIVIGVFGFVILTLQLGGWYANAHRYAVGSTGRRLFWLSAQWQPPGGWIPVLCSAVLGSLLMAGAVLAPGGYGGNPVANSPRRGPQ